MGWLFEGSPVRIALKAWALGALTTAAGVIAAILYFDLSQPDEDAGPEMGKCDARQAYGHMEFHRLDPRDANRTAFHFHNFGWTNITNEPRSFGGFKVSADCPESRQ